MMPSWIRLLLTGTVCTAAALGLGFVCGSDNHGFAQPGLLVVAIPAAILGFRSQRAFLGAVFGPLLGYAGAVGLLLSLQVREENWLICIGVLGSLGALVCVLAGAAAGYVGGWIKRP